MPNKRQEAKLVTGTDFLNLAHSYRFMAESIPNGRNRERLLSMAQWAENMAASADERGLSVSIPSNRE